MRYSICYTPSARDPLTLAASSWLGRSVYSGEAVEHPEGIGLSQSEIAFHTALPRRNGFHACLKAPFRLHPDVSEAMLLRELMHFSGVVEPFALPALEVGRLGDCCGLMLSHQSVQLDQLASLVMQNFDQFRAPLTEAEIDRMAPERLSAPQFANLYRWGDPHVLDEYRFYLPLTGPLSTHDRERVQKATSNYFSTYLVQPPVFSNLALFVEREQGAPLVVHSLHPMGRVSARKIA
ncbi:DUF1045 domain-containing protein [Allorhizobium terrae]|uniref:DUF1045 domain-containing protein n=1 Tax=Allorhizobium terrae TaxID=1848972 RepID=A0A4V3W939_9HYPH|nr:DUF1045 domain-containing protein [Allorhizobium terrae]THF53707.1 DUF1045 domain-containing protein [Allorhizobium terrae]TWD54272.1 uncharacterized protein DUF1045 [Agrobacterium vitis]